MVENGTQQRDGLRDEPRDERRAGRQQARPDSRRDAQQATAQRDDHGDAPREESGEESREAAARKPVPRPYDDGVSTFVERFAADMTEAGMPRMPSRVFACLLADDTGALGSAELSERLQISPAAVSGAVRYLSHVHMVSRERMPGSRREQYRLHANVWCEAMTNREPVLVRWMSTLQSGVDIVGPDSPAGERMAESAEFLEFLKNELNSVMERWYTHRAAQGRDDAGTAQDHGPDEPPASTGPGTPAEPPRHTTDSGTDDGA